MGKADSDSCGLSSDFTVFFFSVTSAIITSGMRIEDLIIEVVSEVLFALIGERLSRQAWRIAGRFFKAVFDRVRKLR